MRLRRRGTQYSRAFLSVLCDSFDVLYEEASLAKMMSIGLHCRIIGRPMLQGPTKFLDYVAQYQDVWVCRRKDISYIGCSILCKMVNNLDSPALASISCYSPLFIEMINNFD